jgi:four helix bundle protein
MHYEQSIVWAKSIQLAEIVFRNAIRLPREERFGMRAQMNRAAASVACNVAEGWSRESRRERAQFFAIAQGSLAELHTQLILCKRLQWLEPERAPLAFGLVVEVGRMLTKLRQRQRQRIASAPPAATGADPPTDRA